MFCGFKKEYYLCTCYPENNLFTLKKLIPIEDRAISCEAYRFYFFIYLPLRGNSKMTIRKVKRNNPPNYISHDFSGRQKKLIVSRQPIFINLNNLIP